MNIQKPNSWLGIWLEPYEAKVSSTVLRGEENGDIPPSTRLLQQLMKNSERLVIVENDISQIKDRLTGIEETNQKIKSLLGWFKWIAGGVGAIILSLIAHFVYSIAS